MYALKNKALTLLFVFPMLWGCSTQPEEFEVLRDEADEQFDSYAKLYIERTNEERKQKEQQLKDNLKQKQAILSELKKLLEDIKISELTTVCEYSEAVLKVCNKINYIANGRKPEELTDQEKEAVIILNNKFKDLDRAMSKKLTLAEFKECPEFEAIKKLMDGPVDPFI